MSATKAMKHEPHVISARITIRGRTIQAKPRLFCGEIANHIQSTLTLLLALTLMGCTRLQQYRTHYPPDRTANGDVRTLEAIEEMTDYVLGFVEFDEHGWLWDRNQLRAVLKRLYNEEKESGLILLVYAHGWKHNASYWDPDVAMFRKVLGQVQTMERRINQEHPRKIAGVYLGWRGLSLKVWAIKNLTFWERKNTAHAVGQGEVAEVLAELDHLRSSSRLTHRAEIDQGLRQPTLLVVAGHSFGAGVLASSLSTLIQDRLVENIDAQGNAHGPQSFGDLVILVNPAFEACRLQPLVELDQEKNQSTNQAAALGVFTSKGDLATKIAFPIGRFFSTLFEKDRDSSQYQANLQAVGHYQPFISYDLKLKSAKVRHQTPAEEDSAVLQSANHIEEVRRSLKQNKGGKLPVGQPDRDPFTQTVLVPRGHGEASHRVFVVSVDTGIIPNHSDIDTPEFLSFLREFVMTYGDPN